jgi:diphthamide synthase subunit DPH2
LSGYYYTPRCISAGKSNIVSLCIYYAGVQAWVQIACPRLSMDWGSDLPKVSIAPFCVVAISTDL